MKTKLFKLFSFYLFISIALTALFPILASAQDRPRYDPTTGLPIQTLQEYNEQQRNSPAGQARAASNADVCRTLDGIGKIICQIQRILNTIIPFLITLGIIYFIWGVLQYIIAPGDEAKKKGKEQIIYGLIGLTVIVGMWGLVNIVSKTFGLDGDSAVPSLVPLTGQSATCSLEGNPKFQDLLCYVTRIINDSIIPLIFTLAVLMFIWGVVQYVINSDEEAKKEKGKQFMLWGIIALTVMVSVWGLVGILSATFGIDGSILPQVKP